MTAQQQAETAEIQDTKLPPFWKYGCFAIAVLILLGMCVTLYHAVQAAREAARRMTCVPKFIAVCHFHLYHDVHGTFPPAYSTDAEGKPLHSWRVLSLMCRSNEDIGELANIRLDEPWDSEYNSQFHNKMPRYFYCPSRPIEEQQKGLTPYQMVIGPDTISNGPNGTKHSEITRDHGDTLLFVEASVSVPWMKPEDLPQSALQNGVVSSVPQRGKPVVRGIGIGSPHYKSIGAFWAKIPGANVAMTDGSCLFFTAEMPPEELLEKSRIRETVGQDGQDKRE